MNKNIVHGEIGTPKGGTLSPILSNIYLHALDVFMNKKVEDSKLSGPTSVDNPEYKRIHSKNSNMRQVFSSNYRYNISTNLDIEERKKQRSKLKSKISGPGYRIYYVRYADDFLIAINGPKKIAVELKDEIKIFLQKELNLELNVDKTKITSALKDRAEFLGAQIRVSSSRTCDQKRRKESFTACNIKIRARTPVNKILILAPLERITKKLSEQGICKIINFSKRKVIPTRKLA
jgi:uncharacterized protein YdcH (DUF465 family)